MFLIPMTTTASKLRKQIDGLIKSRRALISLNVSVEIIHSLSFAIDDLEDAYIAEVNDARLA